MVVVHTGKTMLNYFLVCKKKAGRLYDSPFKFDSKQLQGCFFPKKKTIFAHFFLKNWETMVNSSLLSRVIFHMLNVKRVVL